MIAVAIVDDEALIRAGLSALLAAQPDIEVVSEVEDGTHVIPLVLRRRPDVILMDVRMPGMDGIQATAALIAAVEAPPRCSSSRPSRTTTTSTTRCAPGRRDSC